MDWSLCCSGEGDNSISNTTDDLFNSLAPMNLDETTSDSGIGLETSSNDDVIGDVLMTNQSGESAFCSVKSSSDFSLFYGISQTDQYLAASRDSELSASANSCCSFDDSFFDDDASSSPLTTELTATSSFKLLLDGALANSNVEAAATDCQHASERQPTGRQSISINDCSLESSQRSTLSKTTARRQHSTLSDVTPNDDRQGLVGYEHDPVSSISEEDDAFTGDVKKALSRTDDRLHNLIGDLSAEYALPVVANWKHADLKTIRPDTLAAVMSNCYSHSVQRCFIIDCRYPYEFEAGHIENAHNICTREAIMEKFFHSNYYQNSTDLQQRTIFIFHCEFSSERAPSLLRFLRNQDRAAHSNRYPKLHYPELYLLEGGYKAFFESHVSLCQPPFYRPMLHADHTVELRHFRLKSKSWAAGSKKSQQQRVPRGLVAREGAGGLMSRRKSLWI